KQILKEKERKVTERKRHHQSTYVAEWTMGSNRRLDGGTSVTRVIEDLGKAEGNRSSAEAGHDAGDHLAQRIEMISAFQGHGESAPEEASREGCAPGHEFEVSGGREEEQRKWVAVVRIDFAYI